MYSYKQTKTTTLLMQFTSQFKLLKKTENKMYSVLKPFFLKGGLTSFTQSINYIRYHILKIHKKIIFILIELLCIKLLNSK
jgi:hypothetical protein